ncbi:MAG: OsmC family protein [Longimicrobiales bacterium]|nr:OsmC family protein [Longimicrobiales bacterium]
MGQPMIVTHEGGMKFATDIRGHRVVVDQPQGVGADEGPMPLELLGASVGTCVALYVQQFCETRGLPYEGMRVEVEQIGARNPSRVGRFEVRVVLREEIPSEYAGMLERVAKSCPAHNTLVSGSEVAVRIEQEAPATA